MQTWHLKMFVLVDYRQWHERPAQVLTFSLLCNAQPAEKHKAFSHQKVGNVIRKI